MADSFLTTLLAWGTTHPISEDTLIWGACVLCVCLIAGAAALKCWGLHP
jgi:hypothetical protein